MTDTCRVLVVDREGEWTRLSIAERRPGDLPDGEVAIRVAFSSVNCKVGQASLPRGGVVRRRPHVPGIDLAGTVRESRDAHFREGDAVPAAFSAILEGQIAGRMVVRLGAEETQAPR